MKISSIDIFPLSIQLKGSFRNAHLAKTWQNSIVLKVQTTDGVDGLGNVDPDPGHSEESFSDTLIAIRGFTKNLIGLDPLNILAALDYMDQLLPGHLDAKAAVEMALFDIKGKALGVPVHSLLGGLLREEIYLNGWIGILSPDEAASEARAWVERGFRSAKIKVGSGVMPDFDRVKAVRETVGNKMALRVDANEAYPVEDAIRLAKAIAPFDITLFEQPVPRRDLAGMAKVRKAVDIPIMADESVLGPETLVEIIKKEAAEIVKVKVMKQGGIHRTFQMIEMAEAAGIRCVIGHGFGLAVNTLAEIHVAASCRNLLEECEFVGPLKIEQDVVSRPLQMDSGKIKVPQESGLGVRLDENRLKQCIQA